MAGARLGYGQHPPSPPLRKNHQPVSGITKTHGICGYDDDMHLLLPIIFVFALVFGPGWWVRHVMSRYSSPEDRYDGTGGELADIYWIALNFRM